MIVESQNFVAFFLHGLAVPYLPMYNAHPYMHTLFWSLFSGKKRFNIVLDEK